MEFIKSPTPFDQLPPSAALDDTATVEYEDEVRIPYGGQSMRDNDEGVSRQSPLDRVSHTSLDHAVQRRCCFVEDHDVRVSQEPAAW